MNKEDIVKRNLVSLYYLPIEDWKRLYTFICNKGWEIDSFNRCVHDGFVGYDADNKNISLPICISNAPLAGLGAIITFDLSSDNIKVINEQITWMS